MPHLQLLFNFPFMLSCLYNIAIVICHVYQILFYSCLYPFFIIQSKFLELPLEIIYFIMSSIEIFLRLLVKTAYFFEFDDGIFGGTFTFGR